LNEEIIFIASVLAGSLSTVAIDKIMKRGFSKGTKNDSASYESVRMELNSLEFEKNIAAESAMKVDEAFEEKRIDVYERDKLLQQYSRQIEQYDERIEKYQNMIDVADLRNERDNLTEIINKRIVSIDQRLRLIHNRFEIPYESRDRIRLQELNENTEQNNLGDSSQNSGSRRTKISLAKQQGSVSDQLETKSIEELQNQIILELDRLEETEAKDSRVDDKTKKAQVASGQVEIQDDVKLAPRNGNNVPRTNRDALAYFEGPKVEDR
jgi:hypothetical protein